MDKNLSIKINRPIKQVYDFVVDPNNTPKWVDAIKREEASEYPIKVGTVYRPYGEGDVAFGDYPIVELEDQKVIAYSKDGADYLVRCTFTPIEDGGTRVDYFATGDEASMRLDPGSPESLAKLKAVLEGDV